MQKIFLVIFFINFVTRFIFSLITGFYNNYLLQSDSRGLVNFAEQALQGNFNFEFERFVVSPLFIIIVAFFKLIFVNWWDTSLIIFQLIISSLSGVFIYKIANLLFKNFTVALTASLLYAVFPLTFWYVNTFSQDTLFQCLFIFSSYYLLLSLETKRMRHVIISSVLFSLSYLTKSHILLFSIFIPLIYFHKYKFSKIFFNQISVFTGIALLFTIPWGIYQLKINDVYVISSNGAGYQFYVGNTEVGYKTVVDVPEKDSDDYRKIKDVRAGYFNYTLADYDSILNLPQKIKQKVLFEEALTWISSNPDKFIKLKIYNLLFFLLPGVSFRHYDLVQWFFSFIISLPVYIFAYIAIAKNLFKTTDTKHYFVFYLFLSMVLFSVVWYVQNRFRAITIDPFYIVYCSVIITEYPLFNKVYSWLLKKFKIKKSSP